MQYFVIIAVSILSLEMCAQTGPDDRLLASIRQQLALSPEQDSFIESSFRKAAQTIDSLDQRINELERTATDEMALSTDVAVLNQKKKDARELRDLEVQIVLTPDQRLIYDEKIRPVRPQVMHFGFTHDRMNCNVCNK